MYQIAKKHFLFLPYKENRADNITKSMKKTVHILLPENFNTQIAYTGRKFSTYFRVNGKIKFDYQHDLVYHAKCPIELSDENYIVQSGRHITERVKVKYHNGREHKSHILKHSLGTGHEHVKISDFSIISKNFNGNKREPKNYRAVTYLTITSNT